MLDQELDTPADVNLLLVREAEEPFSEFVGPLNLPGHGSHYAIEGIMRQELYEKIKTLLGLT